MTGVRLYSGVAGSAREQTIDKIAAECWDSCVLVVPTRAEAAARGARIVTEFHLRGAWGRRVVSLEDFALDILRCAGIYPHLLDDIERRILFDRLTATLRDTDVFSSLGDAADSPGFINHIQRVITKLKQAAIDPAQFREALARRKRPSWLDPIVASVYDAYQQALNDTNSYDRVGVYWRADLVLKESRPALFDQVRTVLFDSFDDFTPSEFRLIERILPCVDSAVIGIVTTVDTPSQDDLFAIPRRTVRQIMRRFDGTMSAQCDTPPCKTRVQFAARELFWRSKPVEPKSLRENLQLIACHDIAHECELIGRRVKSLIVEEGVDPDAIAIVFRNIENVATPLRLVLSEFQVPASYDQPRTLADSTLASFILRFFDVANEWERDAVLDTLISPWFSASAAFTGGFDVLARQAGIIEGQREWRECTKRLLEWLEHGEGETRERLLTRMPNVVRAARALAENVQRLADYTSDFPAEAPASVYIEHLIALLSKLDIAERVNAIEDAVQQAFERESLKVIHGVLLRTLAWEKRLPGNGASSLHSVQSQLRRAFDETAVAEQRPPAGVSVITPIAARQRSFQHVFIGGLNEGEFPSPPAADAVYTEEDYNDLDVAGAPLEKRSKHIEREMLLLHHVLSCATESVTVTWRTATGEGGALAPSPFVSDLRELSANVGQAFPTSTSFIPTIEQACSLRDVQNASTNLPGELAEIFPVAFRPILAGVSVEQERSSRKPFGHYDGILSHPSTLDALREIYGSSHAFSAAQLETYAECPFQFFLERVLRVNVIDAAEADFDPRTRGRILHEVLQEFHQTFAGKPTASIPEEEANETMAELCKEIFFRHAHREVTVPRGILEVEHLRMEAQLFRYLQQAREAGEDWAPTHFEVAFGQAHGTARDPLTTSDAFSLKVEGGEVLISGRIDRIDKSDGVARIIDYKATLPGSTKEYDDGVKLQLTLYAVALEEHLMPGTMCKEALLLQPGKAEIRKVMDREKGHWDERQVTARDHVSNCVDGMRSGVFPPTPYKHQCYLCKSSRACRYEGWRVEMKSETAP